MIEAAYPQHFGAEAADDPVALELFSRVPRSGWAGQGFEPLREQTGGRHCMRRQPTLSPASSPTAIG
jgi:hypothetical protein